VGRREEGRPVPRPAFTMEGLDPTMPKANGGKRKEASTSLSRHEEEGGSRLEERKPAELLHLAREGYVPMMRGRKKKGGGGTHGHPPLGK